jgi:UDP-N-acetylmuramoylalanine--D-glutamate ligase
VAAALLLARRGARVVLTERGTEIVEAAALREAGVVLELGGHTAATFDHVDLIVTSPGVPFDEPVVAGARAGGVEVIGELELASRWLQGPIVAITGTKGKSTTTTLVGRMLGAAGRRVLVGGNIGVPLSAQVEASTPETVHVVEASSFQLETTTTFRPWIAAWLNLSADHMDRHRTMEEYMGAKARIFASQRPGDWAVVNAADPVVMDQSQGIAATRVPFSPEASSADGFSVEGEWVIRRTGEMTERLIPVSDVELVGGHMLGNVVAAAAVATLAGVEPQAMVTALRGFRGLEHAMEPAGAVANVAFVNDSRATNVDAALKAIESFQSGVVVLLGGHYKGGDLGDLRAALATRGRAVVAMGEAATLVREALGDVLPVIDADSMSEAVRLGFEAAAPDGVVLLAPACASFDWFDNYAERGRAFKEAVEALRLANSD